MALNVEAAGKAGLATALNWWQTLILSSPGGGTSPTKKHWQALFLLANRHGPNIVLSEVRGHYNLDT